MVVAQTGGSMVSADGQPLTKLAILQQAVDIITTLEQRVRGLCERWLDGWTCFCCLGMALDGWAVGWLVDD